MDEDKKWDKVYEIQLDMSPVFHHHIWIRDRNGNLLDKVKLPPDKSSEIFNKLVSEWTQWKVENA
jgi:putative heme degradation protein